MRFLDLFAGIGGFRMGMEAAGHSCVGFCEIDKFARASYKAIHNTEGEIELHDITKVGNEEVKAIVNVDVICGGFPCQAFSVAGKRKGFEDTRGTLFFEIARFASILKPKYLFLENVKGLLNHDKGRTFKTILRALDGLGYDVEWQVLNSKDFGVPQNRERVFIVGHLRGESTRGVFPFRGESTEYGSEQPKIDIVGNTKNPNGSSYGTGSVVCNPKGIIGTLCARDYKEPKQILVENSEHKVVIRKITPCEYWRLQGFPDEAFENAKVVNSNTQLYKQAGNSVTVNVVEAIAKRFGV